MGKFDSIDDLRDYVQEYLTIHNMSTDDLTYNVEFSHPL